MRWNTACRIVVIDGQGGKIGRQLVEEIRASLPEAEITAVGTNSAATANMLRGGARSGATGENAVCVACRGADIIAGPLGILSADSLYGEITPAMAVAVGQSSAVKILIPINKCDTVVVGVETASLTELIGKAREAVCAAEAEWRSRLRGVFSQGGFES